MINAGQLKALIADMPDDYTPMIRIVVGHDPVEGDEFWTTSISAEDVTEEPGTHELRITIDSPDWDDYV